MGSLPVDTEPQTVFLFGPQALLLDVVDVKTLRDTIYSTPNHQWALRSLEELPQCWEQIAEEVPKLRRFEAKEILHDFLVQFKSGNLAASAFPLRNIITTPLVVMMQIIEYSEALRESWPGIKDDDGVPGDFLNQSIAAGLCTGMLGAMAASHSDTLQQLRTNASTAMKQAMAIGALVDAEMSNEESDGRAVSYSVSWGAGGSLATLEKLMKPYENAYISVLMDERRATVTVSEKSSTEFTKALRAAGVYVVRLELGGRFHWHGHEHEAAQLESLFAQREKFRISSNQVMKFHGGSQGSEQGASVQAAVLRGILVEQCDWFASFGQLMALSSSHGSIISIGRERCVPPTLGSTLRSRFVQIGDAILSEQRAGAPANDDDDDGRIAVVGMACHVPGAEDLEEFWKILLSGQSQHENVPPERLLMDTSRRSLGRREWFGNFIDDYDKFDHKFFKKSPRESASMDPQQRLCLKLAYQAVEQAGYFTPPSTGNDSRVGCYIGMGNVDYWDNIACHPANAYSTTGNLRAFAAGKISHYFGWTGPSLTIDTACSSSSVAVHQACQALLHGECSRALAAGVNIFTSANWFHNLAGASFLSATGQCKPFDASGDGYCRAEGGGAVFLKKLSSAVADGDRVLGVIAATKVYQNQNCTGITVPNVPSLSQLFRDTLAQAKLKPRAVTVVEAHGTGTPVGDPAEYDAIRTALGGQTRANTTLSLMSVKGLVGHAEFASGIISLIKILLMIHHGTIPPQASFVACSPALKATPADRIEIATKAKPWDADFRAALINNYGASGSNASMIVTEPPRLRQPLTSGSTAHSDHHNYPFQFRALDQKSLRAYAGKLRQYIDSQASERLANRSALSVSTLSLQLLRQSNPTLPCAALFSASSLAEVSSQLASIESGSGYDQYPVTEASVILCFGGQISTCIGLDRTVFESATVLRSHLDECNRMCLSLGLDRIYPDIFQKSAIEDICRLHVALFAMQYSCAQTWMECGLRVTATVGHSFGELTALCISGAYSLSDALRVVSRRARIIRDSWGSEKGAMLAVEADAAAVEALLAKASEESFGETNIGIACHNGPKSFTLAGSAQWVAHFQDLASGAATAPKMKRLNVTNGFHSTLVEPLMKDLEEVTAGMEIKSTSIRVERATRDVSRNSLPFNFVAQHLRSPVYFHDAVQRLHKEYPQAVWLEAGSNSSIAAMVSRSVGDSHSNHFQAVNITSNNSLSFLVDTTVSLWKQGVIVDFWLHRSSQSFSPIIIPPYQFEKVRHWMDLKEAPPQSPAPINNEISTEPVTPTTLTSFVMPQVKDNGCCHLQVNIGSPRFQQAINATTIARKLRCAVAMFHVEVALDAIHRCSPELKTASLHPVIKRTQISKHLTSETKGDLFLDIAWTKGNPRRCNWTMSSNNDAHRNSVTIYSTGIISFQSSEDPFIGESYQHLKRLSGRARCEKLLLGDAGGSVDLLQGRSIYRSMRQLIDFKTGAGRVQKIFGSENEAAGFIRVAFTSEDQDTARGSARMTRIEAFCQVPSIFLNLMVEDEEKVELQPENNGVFLCRGFSKWLGNARVSDRAAQETEWRVFLTCHKSSSSEYVADVFVFHHLNGELGEVILGMLFQRQTPEDIVRDDFKRELSEISTRSSTSAGVPMPTASTAYDTSHEGTKDNQTVYSDAAASTKPAQGPVAAEDRPDVHEKTVDLVCNLSGLEPDDVKSDSDLAELGIDSLMAMEVVREVDAAFHVVLSNNSLMELTDFKSLVACIRSGLGLSNDTNSTVNPSSLSATSIASDQTSAAPMAESPSTASASKDSAANIHMIMPNNTAATLSTSTLLETFAEVAWQTDDLLEKHNLAGYQKRITPRISELCVAYMLDAFDELGCSIRSAQAGENIARAKHLAKHERLMKLMYQLLAVDARLIDIDGPTITRTKIAPPLKSAETLLAKLLEEEPTHVYDVKLAALVGTRFADLITGKEDGAQLIFGRQESRGVASDFYAKSPFTGVWIDQLMIFVEKLVSGLQDAGTTLNILEIGAGTGGTTSQILPLLAKLGVPVRYTMSDISGSLVAAARKRFKSYSFVEFKVVDVESQPSPALLQSQHVVLATNCIHATRNLSVSLQNIHKVLRPDGFLMLLETTAQVSWIDFVFGLLESWWLFEDERDYVLAPVDHWETILRSVGFGHVDWTRGDHPESGLQRLIIALPSPEGHPPVARPANYVSRVFEPSLPRNNDERQKLADGYIEQYSKGFELPHGAVARHKSPSSHCILVTGATGSLGSHIVAALAQREDVGTVICINRLSNAGSISRQKSSFDMRGIELNATDMAKLEVIETDTSKPSIGLSGDKYQSVIKRVTHVVHSAWPMSLTRPIRMYETQMKILKNLISLAVDITEAQPTLCLGFQFVSSIAVVANYPLWKNSALVPEQMTTVESVPLTGYAEAKQVCEGVLSKTLRRYPDRFQAMAVRVAQISGSTTNGYWNNSEYIPFLIKTSQSLGILPRLDGTLSWFPVDGVAATLGELLMSESAKDLIYHIDNPSRQGWREMTLSLAGALGLGENNIVPFEEWVDRVRRLRGSTVDNPALQLIDFFENYFIPMSCGDLVLDTTKASSYSETLRNQAPISDEVVGKYIASLRKSGFLN
ncbi:hybrid PKS/NRPS enzyme [Cordyceps javanica]|uniref:Hybrid PKS/NRPS enzyme n=1 Tax=Cordyceps javanica TaxID=43265 RepID=A0A545W8D3_9HYPO|nr:hybrid PKS/NRPS enzyme [Cordyceps javanica]TQW10239.1 hybrid PKS/NRPS enzyme [Cordyceps javanica]